MTALFERNVLVEPSVTGEGKEGLRWIPSGLNWLQVSIVFLFYLFMAFLNMLLLWRHVSIVILQPKTYSALWKLKLQCTPSIPYLFFVFLMPGNLLFQLKAP